MVRELKPRGSGSTAPGSYLWACVPMELPLLQRRAGDGENTRPGPLKLGYLLKKSYKVAVTRISTPIVN